ncbi:MAG: hypothetical protein HY039_00610 [Nitrospirae bacterium]|nr:hypothetical protein [Nitrospirota bacterium]
MSRRNLVLIAVLLLLAGANLWSRLSGEEEPAPRTAKRVERPAAKGSLPVRPAPGGAAEVVAFAPDAPEVPPPKRNLFAYADVPPAPPKPAVPPGPPPPPPKSPEEIAAEQARSRLGTFRFEGAMSRGAEKLLMLSRGEEVLTARSGEEVVKGVRVRETGPSSVEIEDGATGVKVTLVLKEGK